MKIAERRKRVDKVFMSTNSINSLASSYVQSAISAAVKGTAPSTNTNTASVGGSSPGAQSDSGQLSPFAQMMNTLEQLQQTNPTEYEQVTSKIATSLQTAAKTATADGNTSAASQLNELATDFTNASQSGQPLKMQSVAKAIGGGGGHHHRHGGSSSSSSSSSSTSSTDSTSTSSATSPISQFLASLDSTSSQEQALNPLSIIANTMSNAGITSSSPA
jgi:hypothetical protein